MRWLIVALGTATNVMASLRRGGQGAPRRERALQSNFLPQRASRDALKAMAALMTQRRFHPDYVHAFAVEKVVRIS